MFDSVEKITVENKKEIVVKELFWILSVVKWTLIRCTDLQSH